MFKPALVATLVAACFCSAQADDIEHISIYANRTATPEQDVLASVTVLERDDIVARQATDLPALLAQLPGINLSRDGGRGQNSSIYVRGGNTGHTLVLIDGVRSGSATLGYKALAMLPVELIERIEVIRGPRAALYGSDALSGVIAITTRRPSQLEVNVAAGSYGQVSSDLHLSHQQGDLLLQASAGASQADGFDAQPGIDTDNDGYQQKFIKLAAQYQTAVGLWQAQADVNSGFYQYDNAWSSQDQADTLNRAYLLGWQFQQGSWQHQATLSRTLDRDATFGPDSRSPYVTERDEFNYQATTQLTDAVSAIAGVNWYQEQVERSAVAYDETSRTNRAWFTGLQYQLQALNLEATVRRDVINHYGAQNTWQLAAGYQLSEQWFVWANRGSAFKAPTFNELYWPGFGNPDLQPQESVSDELGVRYQTDTLQLTVSGFDREVTNLIQGIEQAQNVVLAKISGAEVVLAQQWQAVSSQLAYTWLDTENAATGNMLERRPQHTINWRGNYDAGNWSLFVTADYQSETYQGAFAPVTELGGFTLWGIGGGYQLSDSLTLRAKVDNLLDKRYQSSAGYATAGVNFGISLSFIPAK